MGFPSGQPTRQFTQWRRYRDPDQPSRVYWEFPAAPMRDRDIHDASSTGGRRIVSGSDTRIVAMTDRGRTYDYPPTVCFQIEDHKVEDYARAACS